MSSNTDCVFQFNNAAVAWGPDLTDGAAVGLLMLFANQIWEAKDFGADIQAPFDKELIFVSQNGMTYAVVGFRRLHTFQDGRSIGTYRTVARLTLAPENIAALAQAEIILDP